MWKQCPKCARQLPQSLSRCTFCRTELPVADAQKPKQVIGRSLRVIALSLIGAAIVIGSYFYLKIYPRMRRLDDPYYGSEPSRWKKLSTTSAGTTDFDLSVKLETKPLGLAAAGSQLIAGNQTDPWGLTRIRRTGERFERQIVPIIEPAYFQRMSFNTVAWNGKELVGYTTAGWFGSKDPSEYVFTRHDAKSLHVTTTSKAPPRLGCLAWDGKSYWAATRNNTNDSGEEKLLYKLNERFDIERTYPSPATGCQGMAWDGTYLWLADVFSDQIFILDVSGERPKTIRAASTKLDYLAGLAYDGTDIWIAEYDEDRLHRLKRDVQLAWTDTKAPKKPAAVTAAASTSSPAVAELKKKLRSSDQFERMRAESQLKDLGETIDYDLYVDPFPDPVSPRKVEVDRIEIEVRDGVLYGSWNLYVGEDYFRTTGAASSVVTLPFFTKYKVNIDTPSGDIEKEFDARPGTNSMRDVVLVPRVESGTYSASIFIHVQYVNPEGTPSILNINGMPVTVKIR